MIGTSNIAALPKPKSSIERTCNGKPVTPLTDLETNKAWGAIQSEATGDCQGLI